MPHRTEAPATALARGAAKAEDIEAARSQVKSAERDLARRRLTEGLERELRYHDPPERPSRTSR